MVFLLLRVIPSLRIKYEKRNKFTLLSSLWALEKVVDIGDDRVHT